MSVLSQKWDIYPRAPQSHFAEFPDLEKLVVQILYNRGIFTVDAVNSFVSEKGVTADPFLLQGMRPAVKRISQALAAGEPIIVYGDYDADGVTATALLVQALKALGARVEPYIPDRFEEGYGLNNEAIAQLAADEASLVITVDCGIRSGQEVAYGNGLGLDFIITDHHQVPRNDLGADVIPPAVAVINPNQSTCSYPFKELAGVGVAYKLVQALRQTVVTQNGFLSPLSDERLLDLVAIGTVADMAPLIGENRSLVIAGLRQLNNPRRPGLMAMIEHSRLQPGQITAGNIGFVIGPRLNAAGRLTHAQLAYSLLSTANLVEAHTLARRLDQTNAERQQLTQSYVDRARGQIVASKRRAPLYLVIEPDFNEGVVGLVASRLTDEFYRPVLVARQGETHTRGSARSIPEFDITRALDQCADLLVKYGGHAAAAGFTLTNENLPAFQTRLQEIARRKLGEKVLKKTILIDAEINLRGVSAKLVRDIQALRPFGYSNPTPRFYTADLVVKHYQAVGRDGAHLKLGLFDGKQLWPAIGFGLGRHWPWQNPLQRIDVVYTLEFNYWNGQSTLQLNLKDFRLNQN